MTVSHFAHQEYGNASISLSRERQYFNRDFF